MNDAVIAVVCVFLAGGLGFAGWLTKALIDLKTDVATVKAEHRTNGGASTRDAINRIEGRQVAIAAKLDDHLIASAADSALLAQHLTQPH